MDAAIDADEPDNLNDPNMTHSPHTLPAITVVTPSYNQGQFIESTIQSVLSQNYPILEYIVIDACSTDNTHEVLKKYESEITQIIIEPDKESANAFHKGLVLTNGEWFNWLNSDDVPMPVALLQLAMHARITRRICSTRLAPSIRMIFIFLAVLGTWPSRMNLKANVFNVASRKLETVQPRDYLLF